MQLKHFRKHIRKNVYTQSTSLLPCQESLESPLSLEQTVVYIQAKINVLISTICDSCGLQEMTYELNCLAPEVTMPYIGFSGDKCTGRPVSGSLIILFHDYCCFSTRGYYLLGFSDSVCVITTFAQLLFNFFELIGKTYVFFHVKLYLPAQKDCLCDISYAHFLLEAIQDKSLYYLQTEVVPLLSPLRSACS